MNGYDKYLEYQFGWSGSFYKALFECIQLADQSNQHRLAKGFPEEVEAYQTWAYIGRDAFLAKCSPDHPLLLQVKAGEIQL